MINLTAVIDNDEAVRKLHELQSVAKQTTSSVVKDSERMDASWQQMKNSLMSITAGVSFAALAKQVVQVRGEVQQLEVAFETMLGSKEKADSLMSEIIELAAKTPFGLQDVSNATKMLLAYGSSSEEVAGEIKMLGNIASGLSIPLNDLIYLYGTTRTQGRMFTQDLRQFMGRGIPLAEELAKQFGVTKDKVGELVTAGRVGFPDMQKALEAMTSEGGKFNNLMEKQSATITGQISNLEDSIYQMFNEIGKSSEGVISDLISGASWVVEHYQEILDVLKYLITAYGAYKAAVILVAAAQKAMALGVFVADLYKVVKGVTSLTAAVKALGLATKTNPIGLIASGLAIVATAFIDFNDEGEDAVETIGELEQAARDEYVQVNKLAHMLKDVNTSEDERKRILGELKAINPSIVEGLDAEALSVETLTKNVNDYCDAQLKSIQLASISDKMHGLLKTKADAEANAALLEKDIIQQAADYETAGYKTIRTEKESDEGIESLYSRMRDDYDKIIRETQGNAIERARRLAEWEGKTYEPFSATQRNTLTIKGTGLGDKYKQLEGYRKAIADADAAIKDFGEDAQFVIDKLGLGADTSAEDVKTYAQAVKDARIELTEARKALKVLKDDPNSSEKAVKAAEARVADAEKTAKEYGIISTKGGKKDPKKEAEELARLQQELENEASQARIDEMAEGAAKQRAQAEHDHELRKQQIDAQKAELTKKQGGTITEEQTVYFNTLYTSNDKKRDKSIADINKPQEEAMREHLIAYGTFLEKKQALAEKYDKAIAEAEAAGDKAKAATLKKERIEQEAAYYDEVVSFSETIKSYTLEQLESALVSVEELLAQQEEALSSMPSSQNDVYLAALQQVETLKQKIVELEKAQGKKQKTANKDAKATEKQTKATEEFLGVLSQSANIFQQAGDMISEFNEPLGNAFKLIGDMAGASYTLISTLSSVTSAASASGAALSAMEKASVILTAISVGLQLIQKLLQFITFDKEEEEYEKLTKRYEGLNDIWDELISKKREYIEMSYGKEAENALRETQDLIEQKIALERQMAREYLDVRKNKREIGKGMSWEGYSQLMNLGLAEQMTDGEFYWALQYGKKKLTNNISWSKILYMTPEQLAELKENAGLWWAELDEGLKGYLENIIAGGAELADAYEALKDQITQTTFDEVRDNFFDTLMDMDALAEDVANDISEYFYKAMLFNELGAEYEERLNAWRDKFATMAEDGLTEEEMEALRKEYMALWNEAKEKADAIADITGYGDEAASQEATSRGFNAMSQETGDELDGRFTDIQGKVTGINEAVQFIKSLNIEQIQHTQSISQTVAAIHNDTSLIERHTRVLADIDGKLATISKNTENL